jgi:hypothetical protein
MILANLTALIAATAIKTKLSQTGERKTNRKNWGSLCGSADLWHPRRRNTLPDCNMIFTEAAMTDNEFKSAAESALAVMERHLHALNGLRENDLADTLHFPHFRLVGTKLDCWPSAETYLSDFRARAGDNWARTAWQEIDIQRESADKVHLAVRINRFDINDQLIADFDSLWVITFKNGKWAAQFRSSFAAS